jgi:hypothetical protein
VWAQGPMRLSSVDATLGAPARAGTVVAHATSTQRIVTLNLPVAQMNLLKRGDAVAVQLPDGTHATGKIAAIVPVAVQQAAGNGRQPVAVDVTVTLDDPNAGAAFDAAPVTVDITQSSVRGVLAVPINALVAPADGGFALELVEGSTHRLVAVRTGVFSRTLVEVSGDRITEGATVVVPAQ